MAPAQGPRPEIAAVRELEPLRSIPRWVGMFAVLAGVGTVVGWYANIHWLTDWTGSGISMFPNTAVCAALSGVCLFLVAPNTGGKRRSQPVVNVLAVAVMLIAVLTVFQHLTDINLGIDTLLVSREWGQAAAAAPMRMGPPASSSFTALGCALLLLGSGEARGRRIATALGTIALAIASLSLLGYLFGAQPLYTLPRLTGIALQTAIIIAALAVGVIASVPERGLTRLLMRRDSGGFAARRLLIPLLAASVLLGMLRVAGERAGYYDSAFGSAARTLAEIMLLIVVVRWAAGGLARAERVAAKAEELRSADQETLKSRDRLLASVTENAQIGMVIVNAEHRYVYANSAYAQVLGLATHQIIGHRVADVLPRAYEEQIRPRLMQAFAGEHVQYELALQPASAGSTEQRYFAVNYRPQPDDAGRITNVIVAVTDITSRKRAEFQLSAEGEALKALNELGARLWRTQSLQDGLEEMLASVLELLQADMGNIQLLDEKRGVLIIRAHHGFKEDFLDFFAEVGVQDDSACGRTLREGRRTIIEDVESDEPYRPLRPLAQTAGYRSVQSTPLIDYSGNPLGMISTHWRIPHRPSDQQLRSLDLYARLAASFVQRKRHERERELLLESERAARAEVERAGRTKDEFLATLSHELRTPLNAILGWAQILSRDNAGSDLRSIREGLAVIERNARAQAQLIEDLLDLSRIISGKVRLDVQRVELPLIIESGMLSVSPAADAKGIRLTRLVDPQAGPVTGDPGRLQQILWNLLSNAIKFTDRGGRITVALARVNSHVELSVADTGQGIEPSFLPHVFDRFRQQDASTTRRHGGLGVGLSIVKQLVELHGGKVSVRSAGVGKGATFAVELPLTPLRPVSEAMSDEDARRHPSAARDATHSQNLLRLDGLRVLVVDDDLDAADLVKRLLEECGATVDLAHSVDDALAQFVAVKPNLLLSDIGMPEKDGYDLIQLVRQRERVSGKLTPAIALTAFARSEDRTRALHAGYQMHLAKPVEPSELVTVVASVVGKLPAASGTHEQSAVQ